MNIKLTEIVRATTISLNIKDAPRQTSLLIHDAFAKLVADLDDRLYSPAEKALIAQWKADTAFVSQGPTIDEINAREEVIEATAPVAGSDEPPAKRRGRPKKVEEPAVEPTPLPTEEPTPLEQAIAAAEDKEPAGETAPSPETDSPSPSTEEPTRELSPVSDRDLQTYCVKAAQHYGGAAKVYDLCKPFVDEGAVARPSNIKGDDKRWQFIRAVEADSGVKFHG